MFETCSASTMRWIQGPERGEQISATWAGKPLSNVNMEEYWTESLTCPSSQVTWMICTTSICRPMYRFKMVQQLQNAHNRVSVWPFFISLVSTINDLDVNVLISLNLWPITSCGMQVALVQVLSKCRTKSLFPESKPLHQRRRRIGLWWLPMAIYLSHCSGTALSWIFSRACGSLVDIAVLVPITTGSSTCIWRLLVWALWMGENNWWDDWHSFCMTFAMDSRKLERCSGNSGDASSKLEVWRYVTWILPSRLFGSQSTCMLFVEGHILTPGFQTGTLREDVFIDW